MCLRRRNRIRLLRATAGLAGGPHLPNEVPAAGGLRPRDGRTAAGGLRPRDGVTAAGGLRPRDEVRGGAPP